MGRRVQRARGQHPSADRDSHQPVKARGAGVVRKRQAAARGDWRSTMMNRAPVKRVQNYERETSLREPREPTLLVGTTISLGTDFVGCSFSGLSYVEAWTF